MLDELYAAHTAYVRDRAEPTEGLLERVRADVIGDGMAIETPYGTRRLCYADQTASGRALGMIEDAVRREVLPSYGNTHTDRSYTGRRTGQLREQAREVIRAAVGGDASTAVIFCGSGSTAAVDKLIGILGLRAATPGRPSTLPAHRRAVVFVGPYEHHSNELPWRESTADVIVIPPDASGQPDLVELDSQLRQHADRPLKIGSFSAGSNVTGLITDVTALSEVLRRHGALVCFDYAAAVAHRPLVMVASGRPVIDAAYLSPHKLPGGPGTPGILLVRRDLVRNPVPTVPGGGTVDFVSPTACLYTDDVEAREEGGTPAIVGAIRAGLVFRLRERVGVDTIAEREDHLVDGLLTALGRVPGVDVLGDPTAPRMGVVSFRVRDPRGRGDGFLHHEFVVAVLSDLFGIQARGGCSCAAPYGHRLLGISPAASAAIEADVRAGYSGRKPGWVRLSVAYYMSETLVTYLSEAVALIAAQGDRLLTDYHFDEHTGAWSHRSERPAGPTLSELDLQANWPAATTLPESVLADHLAQARTLLGARTASGPSPAADRAWRRSPERAAPRPPRRR